jgi:hypothetical protein
VRVVVDQKWKCRTTFKFLWRGFNKQGWLAAASLSLSRLTRLETFELSQDPTKCG